MYKTSEDLDSTTKNIVKELMRECNNKNIPVTEEFVIFNVKLLMLNPSWNVSEDTLPERSDLIKFVNYALGRLKDANCPRIRTMKMQLYFEISFQQLEDMVAKKRSDLKEKLSSLEKEIIEARTDDKEDLKKILKKIIYLITLYSGLGNPTVDAVYKEAEIALQSIFLEPDLIEFINQEASSKELQLVELTELVTGIRLFNRDCQKGGIGIEDIPKLLIQATQATINDIRNTLATVTEYNNLLTAAIDNCHKMKVDENGYRYLEMQLPEGTNDAVMLNIIDLITLYRQKELFVKQILSEVEKLQVRAADVIDNFQRAIDKVHDTVRFRIAVPTIQVFPLFADVSNMWCQLQDQVITLSEFNLISHNINLITRDCVPNDSIKVMTGPSGPISEAVRRKRTNKLRILGVESEFATVVYPEDDPDFENIQLQYLGFCAWKLVETNGGLIPGNPNMGIIKVDEFYYAFSSLEAAHQFGKDPQTYILKGLELGRQKRACIKLLNIEDQLRAVLPIKKLVVEKETPIETFDVEVQTILHPEPIKIDRNYKWNIWDWKRQAILLANISKRVTHSTQTWKSNAWNPIRTQTEETKDFNYQTKNDNYTNVPTLSNYIYGLRGRKDNVQHIISLTRPVDE